MNKAEYELLTKSIHTAYMDSCAGMVLLYALTPANPANPQEFRELEQLNTEHTAAAVLLRVMKKTVPGKATRESLLLLTAEEVGLTNENKAVIKAAAELLASVPTPETLTAGSIKKSVHLIPKAVNVLPKIPIAPKEEPAATAAVTVARSS